MQWTIKIFCFSLFLISQNNTNRNNNKAPFALRTKLKILKRMIFAVFLLFCFWCGLIHSIHSSSKLHQYKSHNLLLNFLLQCFQIKEYSQLHFTNWVHCNKSVYVRFQRNDQIKLLSILLMMHLHINHTYHSVLKNVIDFLLLKPKIIWIFDIFK